MIRLTALLLPAALLGPALAQKADLKVEPAKDQAQRFTITTKIETNETRKTLVNGEEVQAGAGGGGGARGAGGGGGESKVSQEVIFDEGPADANWRHYRKLISTETRAGQEPRETKGSLEGKKVTLKAGENGAVVLAEGEGDQAKAVDASLSRGVPSRLSLAGFVPGKTVAIGEEFDLSKTFAGTLRNLVHPVAAEGGGGGRGGGGAQGGGEGGKGGGEGRGGRGGGMGGGGRGAGSTVSQLISGGKLNAAVTGKLTAIEKQDGADIAVIAITGKLTGKGTGEELGLMAGFGRGGRGGGGGGGGGQGAAAGTDKADASFDINGKIRVNLATHQVAAVELAGNVTVARDSSFGTEDRKMETTSNTKGKFELNVRCEPAKADSKETKQDK